MSLFAFFADTAHGAEKVDGVFPAFDATYFPSQIFWLIVTFGALYFILSRMILPRLGANLERRSDTIADDLDEAARLNEQAEDAQQALEVNLAKARTGARATVQQAEAKMAEEIAAETRKVDEQLEQKLDAAEARIAELRRQAMSNVEAVATDATEAILQRLGMTLTKPEIEQAVSEAVKG